MKKSILSKQLIYALFFLSFIPENLSAQQVRRFSANALVGLSAAQIDGDKLWGYDKLGIQSGIQVNTALGKRSEVGLGFAFCQRGSQSKLLPDKASSYFSLTLNYVEVPLLFSYKDWWVGSEENENDGFYKVSFDGGISYGRLINAKLNEDHPDVIADQFRDNDFSLILGASFNVNRRFGFSFRYNRSLVFMWNPNTTTFPDTWNGHFLSLLSRFNF